MANWLRYVQHGNGWLSATYHVEVIIQYTQLEDRDIRQWQVQYRRYMNGSGYNIVYHMTEVSDNGRGMEGKSI